MYILPLAMVTVDVTPNDWAHIRTTVRQNLSQVH
jgi:hypothetical protein